MIIEDMTMPEFIRGLEKTRTVLVPFGATEEHGPHLPLSTDTLHAVEVGRKLAERRDPINVSRYADSVESLRQLRAKIEHKRIEQEERLHVLRMHRRNAEYEARATIQMQDGQQQLSLALSASD